MALLRIAALATIVSSALAIPADPHFFAQRVDHFSVSDAMFMQRYYLNDTSFGGAGHPIIVILGGEGAIEPASGIFYPSIVELAVRLRALVIEPEHRGYGTSQPTPPFSPRRLSLITAPQALADAAAFILAMQRTYGCTGEGGGPRCAVLTVGGSYPGFLSAMMRLRYPAIVDAAYAGSAPMKFYAQAVPQYAYYEVVTRSAERASPGCAAAVRAMFAGSIERAPKDTIVARLNLCMPLPPYLEAGDARLLADEVAMVAGYTFANLNMANYPPPDTALLRACHAIQAAPTAPWDALSAFLSSYSSVLGGARGSHDYPRSGVSAPIAVSAPAAAPACYNLSAQLPSGDNATISAGDWSGVGTGDGGTAWDWETCSLLVEAIGFNGTSDMFPPRAWSIEWLRAHCGARFGVVPQPRELADLWGFDEDRLASITSHIVFTNGLNDGWSAGGILVNLSDTLLAYNIADGAHHSDLAHTWPSDADTPDVRTVRGLVADLVARWLNVTE